MSAKQIAEVLHISEKTVERHNEHVRALTGCPNAMALVRYAVLNGYYD